MAHKQHKPLLRPRFRNVLLGVPAEQHSLRKLECISFMQLRRLWVRLQLTRLFRGEPLGRDGWSAARYLVSSVPHRSSDVRNGALPMIWLKEWFSSTTRTMRGLEAAACSAAATQGSGSCGKGPSESEQEASRLVASATSRTARANLRPFRMML